jgi:hypothetical protein
MTLQHLLDTGSGKLAFRLVIEGAGYQPVTHHSMEQLLPDGRIRFVGLGDSITWGEVTDPGRATTQWDGFDAQILDTERTLYATKLFSWAPSGRRFLRADMTASSTTMVLDSTAGIAEEMVLHVGSEAVLVTSVDSATDLTVIREYWDTIGQAQYTGDDLELSAQAVHLERARTLEGRRAYVYGYGDGDDPQGDGTLMMRGIVQTDGRLAEDGSHWRLKIGHIGALLKQDLGADLEAPTGARGIYYPASAPLLITFRDFDASVNVLKYFAGFYPSNQALCDDINAWFTASVLSTATDMARLDAVATTDGKWAIDFETGPTNTNFCLTAASMVDGPLYRVVLRDTGEIVSISSVRVELTPSTVYRLDVNPGQEVVDGERTVPRGIFTEGIARGDDELYYDPTIFTDGLPDATTYPPRRIYLSGIIEPRDEAVHIEWGDSDDETSHEVTAVDTAARSVDLNLSGAAPDFGLTRRVYTGTAPIRVTFRRLYAHGDILAFVLGLTGRSPDLANLGAAPFLVSDDIGSWSESSDPSLPLSVRSRLYVSQGHAIKLEDYLAEELKLRGLFLRSDANGRLDVAKLRSVSITQVPDHEIDEYALGTEGLPTWERTERGSLNTVEFSTGYNPVTDEHENAPITIRNVAAFSERKAPRTLEVKPYSIDTAGTVLAVRLGSLPPREVVGLFSTVLGIFGGDYAVATMMVTLQHYDVLCGQIVRFSASHLPNTVTGERGGTFTGQVIGRTVDARAGRIQLRVLVGLGVIRGYAPSCGVDTGNSNGAGASWTLRLLYTDPDANSLWWHTSDVLSDHVKVGDRIRIQRWNDSSAGAVIGTVDVVRDSPNVEVDVTFDGAWAIGGDQWVVDFAPAAEIQADTSGQDDYAFEAADDGFIDYDDGDERASEYAP